MIDQYIIARDRALSDVEAASAKRDLKMRQIAQARDRLSHHHLEMAETGEAPDGMQTLTWAVERSGVLITAAEAEIARALYVVEHCQRRIDDAVAAIVKRREAGLDGV